LSKESPAGVCVVCQHPRRLPTRPPVCDADRTALDSMLREIPDLLARLDPAGAGNGSGPKVSGSKDPPVPLSVDVVDLTTQSRGGTLTIAGPDQIGYLSVATELDFWVMDWRLLLWSDHSIPLPTVAVLAGWLRNRLDIACDEHPAIDEFAAKIRQIHKTLTRMVGDNKRTGERVGTCPMKLRDDSRCNTPLHADPYVSQVACDRCGTSWASWLTLMAAMQDDVTDEGVAA